MPSPRHPKFVLRLLAFFRLDVEAGELMLSDASLFVTIASDTLNSFFITQCIVLVIKTFMVMFEYW